MGKGERTRAEIIHQAALLFNRKGFAGAAISDVMEATGLEKGGIYRHFQSKDQLALEAFDHAVQLVNGRYLAAIRSSGNALERLAAVVETFRQLQQEVPLSGGCPIMNTAVDSDDTHPGLRQRAREALLAWHRMLAQVIHRGMERGEVSAAADPPSLATQMIAMMEGGLVMARLTDDSQHLERAVAAISSWMESLKPQFARTEPPANR